MKIADILKQIGEINGYKPIDIRIGRGEMDIDFGKPPKDTIPVISIKVKLDNPDDPFLVKTQDYVPMATLVDLVVQVSTALTDAMTEEDSPLGKLLEILKMDGEDVKIDDRVEKLDVGKIVDVNGELMYKIKHPVTEEDTGIRLEDFEIIPAAEVVNENKESSEDK